MSFWFTLNTEKYGKNIEKTGWNKYFSNKIKRINGINLSIDTVYLDNYILLYLHIDSPGQIENQKLEFKAQSKVGSMDNVKHKPGGGDVKIFDDKEYIKQMTGQSPLPESRSTQEVRPLIQILCWA